MFSTRLKSLRTQHRKTQQEMADLLGITRQGYAKYENNLGEPDNSTLSKLADYFKVSTDYLLGRTETPTLSSQDKNTNSQISPKQQEVLNFILGRENLFFKDKPEDIMEALDQFEIYYEVWKMQQNKKTKD